jgi:hypothetical protein
MSQAVMRQHAVLRGHASPQMRLSPGQVCGTAAPRTRETAITLATRQVVAFDHTGIDGLTDRGHGQAILHRCCRANDDLGGHVDHASPLPALDDLGIVNWLRVLGTTERSQINQRICHQFHAIVPLLDAFKTQQQPLECILPCKGPLHLRA